MLDEVRELELFVSVARSLSFTQTADDFNTSQPAVSRAVAQLEERLGVLLFNRTTRTVTLTASGELLLPAAQEVIDSVAKLHLRANAIVTGEIGLVRLGVPPNVTSLAVSEIMAAVARTSPRVMVVPSERPSDQQVALLRSGALDIAILRHPFDERGVTWVDLVSEPLVVYVAEAHPLARLPRVTLEDLGSERLTAYPPSPFIEYLLDVCAAGGYRPSEVRGAAQLSTQMALIASGQYLGLLPARTGIDWPGCVQRPIVGDPVIMSTAAAWIEDRVSDTTRMVTEVIRGVIGTGSIRP